MDTNEHVTDHIPAYALDSLDEAEARQIQAHLEGCETCTAELVEYRQLVGNLALAAPQFDPPPALKSKLMDRIKPRLETSDETGAPESWWDRLNNRLPQLSPAWGIAAVAMILVLAISAQPLQAGFCDMDMEKNQETSHHMDHSGMDHSDHEGYKCCDSDESDSSTGCDSNMNCGPCFVSVSMISNLTKFSAEYTHQYTPRLSSGVVLPSHNTPPFRPPIS